MKKILLSIAILTTSVAAFAQNHRTTTNGTCHSEQVAICKFQKGECKDSNNCKSECKECIECKDCNSCKAECKECNSCKAECKGKKAKCSRNFEGKKRHGAYAFSNLNLTDDQKKKLAELRKNTFGDRKENKVRDKKELTSEQREQIKSEREAKKSAFEAGVKNILTPEQYAKYTENKNAMKSHDKNRHHKKHHNRHKTDKRA